MSKSDIVVLGLLAEDPLYGYELLERIRQRSVGFWVDVAKASVYQALHRLERDGLVVGRAQRSTDGPDRRVYRMTKAGRDRFRDGLAERLAELRPYETAAGTALGFLGSLPAREARASIDAREQALNDLLAAATDERARKRTDGSWTRGVSDAMLARQEVLARAELTWLREFRPALSRGRR